MRPLIHAITPGDHFSPRTGSAVPTVIDALARASADPADLDAPPPQRVLLAAGTYPQRYDSVPAVEYHPRNQPRRLLRGADLAAGRLTGRRPAQQHSLRTMLAEQGDWPPSWIVAHNLVQLVPLVDGSRHRAVLYAHNDLFRTYSRREAAKTLDQAALIVCVSQFLAERVRQQLPAALHQRVVVVPNAADCEQFTPAWTDPQRATEHDDGPEHDVGREPDDGAVPRTDRIRVAFVGRMVPAKGPDVLLRAAAQLELPQLNDPQLNGPGVEITMVGSTGFDRLAELSPYERELRELADQLSVPVTFLPFTDRLGLPQLLRTQHILAVPSRWPEPWGLTVSEGQAAGLAVLASDVGGIPEAISDPSHLVPADDPAAFAAALRRFIEDPQLLAAHRRAARAHAAAHRWHASWRALAGHLESVA